MSAALKTSLEKDHGKLILTVALTGMWPAGVCLTTSLISWKFLTAHFNVCLNTYVFRREYQYERAQSEFAVFSTGDCR